jgi:hypothetical protein
LVGKPAGKKPIGRFRRRSKENMKINLKGIGWEDVAWINLDQNRDFLRAFVNI